MEEERSHALEMGKEKAQENEKENEEKGRRALDYLTIVPSFSSSSKKLG